MIPARLNRRPLGLTFLVALFLGCSRQPVQPPPKNLSEAAFADDLAAAQRFIAAGVDVDQQDQWGNSPLMLTGSGHGTAMADLLLQHGANVNFRARSGDTPLIAAVQANRADIVQRLISHGANVNQGNSESQTPLMLAGVYPRVVRLLLDAGADVNARDKSGLTPLDCVSDLKLEAELIARGADVNAEDVDHGTVFRGAVIAGNVDNVKFLAAHGARIDRDGLPAHQLLLDALRPDSDRSLRALMELGVDINATDSKGNTALMDPFYILTDLKWARWLVDAGIDLSRRNRNGYTAREWARAAHQPALADLLERYESGLEHPARSITPATTRTVTSEPQ